MEVRPGYKQTEIGVIPEDWFICPISCVAEVTSSKRIFESDYVPFGVPFYRGKEISELTKGKQVFPDCYITKMKFDEIASKHGIPRAGDILITAVGTLGNVLLVSSDSNFYFKDGNVIWLRNVHHCVPSFLSLVLKHIRAKILDTSIGSSQRALTIDKIKPILFPLPRQESEQVLISGAQSDIDSLITSLEKLIEKKKNIMKGVMHELLTGKRRLPGFSGERETTIIDTCCHILKGRGLSKSQLTSDGLHDCILYGELFTTYNDVIEVVHSSTNSNEGVDSITGDILLPGSTTTTGIDLAKASALLQDGVRLGGDINILRPKRKLDSSFFAMYLNVVKRYEIAEKTKGITIHHLHGNDIKNVIIELPSLSEQKAISSIIITMGIELHSLENQFNKHRLIKEGMMQELLTGRIRLL